MLKLAPCLFIYFYRKVFALCLHSGKISICYIRKCLAKNKYMKTNYNKMYRKYSIK